MSEAMNAFDWYLDAWRNFGNFEGRSSRPAFWYFCLVNFSVLIFMASFSEATAQTWGEVGWILTLVYAGAQNVPAVGLWVRRLHDTGRTGAWFLLNAIPFGFFILLFMVMDDSQPGDNHYGPNQKGINADPTRKADDE